MKLSETTHIGVQRNGVIVLYAGKPEWSEEDQEYRVFTGGCTAVVALGALNTVLSAEQSRAALCEASPFFAEVFDSEDSDDE